MAAPNQINQMNQMMQISSPQLQQMHNVQQHGPPQQPQQTPHPHGIPHATNHPNQPGQAMQQQPNVPDTDPLVKYQNLLPILKESITNLFKHIVNILQSTSNGQCRQSDVQALNKCMEDFYNISDQVYHWLSLADSTVAQYLMGTKFSTVTSSISNPTSISQQQQQQPNEPQKEVLFYSQYLSNAKRQVKATSELRDLLTNFADSLGKDDNG